MTVRVNIKKNEDEIIVNTNNSWQNIVLMNSSTADGQFHTFRLPTPNIREQLVDELIHEYDEVLQKLAE